MASSPSWGCHPWRAWGGGVVLFVCWRLVVWSELVGWCLLLSGLLIYVPFVFTCPFFDGGSSMLVSEGTRCISELIRGMLFLLAFKCPLVTLLPGVCTFLGGAKALQFACLAMVLVLCFVFHGKWRLFTHVFSGEHLHLLMDRRPSCQGEGEVPLRRWWSLSLCRPKPLEYTRVECFLTTSSC